MQIIWLSSVSMYAPMKLMVHMIPEFVKILLTVRLIILPILLLNYALLIAHQLKQHMQIMEQKNVNNSAHLHYLLIILHINA